MRIRSYRPDDWLQVQAIYDLAKPDKLKGCMPRSANLRLADDPAMRQLFEECEVLVAALDGEVRAFAGRSGHTITWMFVHPSSRRLGLASARLTCLLLKLEGRATLDVAQANAPALAL